MIRRQKMANAGKEMATGFCAVNSTCPNCSTMFRLHLPVPEVLKKVQEEKAKLTQTVQNLTADKAQLDTELKAVKTELESSRQASTQAQGEAKEIQGLKEQWHSFQLKVNHLERKNNDLERAKTEMIKSMESAASHHRMETESLTENVQRLTVDKAQLNANLEALTTELEKSKQATEQTRKEGKIREAELQEKMREQQTMQQQSMSAKSIQIFNLQNNVNALNKQINEVTSSAQAAQEAKVKDYEEKVANLVMEKAILQKKCDEWKNRSDQLLEKNSKMSNPEEVKKLQEDKMKLIGMVQSLTKNKKQLDVKVAAMTSELESSKQTELQTKKEMTNAILSGAQELAIVKSDLETINQTNKAKVTEIETLRSQLAAKEEEATKNKMTLIQLKKIGRMFREQKEEAEKKMAAVEEEKKEVEEELLAKHVSEAASGRAVSPTSTQKLLERINILENETETLKAEKEELLKASTSKKDQATTGMKTALIKTGKTNSKKIFVDWAGLKFSFSL